MKSETELAENQLGEDSVFWPRLVWLHLPAAARGALTEFTGGICPLTPLENRLCALGGEGVALSSVYLLPIRYPENLTLPVSNGAGRGGRGRQYVLAYRARRRKTQRPA